MKKILKASLRNISRIALDLLIPAALHGQAIKTDALLKREPKM